MEQKENLTPTILRGMRADRLANLEKQGRGTCGGTSPLPPGKGWRPHVGRRQRERGLRQNWALFEKLVAKAGASSYAHATRERLLDAYADEPGAEAGVMNAALGSYLAVQETRKGPVTLENWIKALNEALNHWEALADESKKQAEADGAVL
jgi:hypothetical protein